MAVSCPLLENSVRAEPNASEERVVRRAREQAQHLELAVGEEALGGLVARDRSHRVRHLPSHRGGPVTVHGRADVAVVVEWIAAELAGRPAT